MGLYELERKLHDKVDMWQFHELNNKISRLEQDNRTKEETIGRLQNQLNSCINVIREILTELDERFETYHFSGLNNQL